MNRRQFLKRIGVVCAAAVVASTALVKAKKKTGWENDVGGRWPAGSIISGERSEHGICGERAKYIFIGSRKAVIFDEFTKGGYDQWKRYAALSTKEDQDNINKMKRVSELHIKIVKQALQRQAQYDKTQNKSR